VPLPVQAGAVVALGVKRASPRPQLGQLALLRQLRSCISIASLTPGAVVRNMELWSIPPKIRAAGHSVAAVAS
jgi:hypothetical protein